MLNSNFCSYHSEASMHHNCVGKNNRKLAFKYCVMAVVNANKPESLKILITVTLMVKDGLTGEMLR